MIDATVDENAGLTCCNLITSAFFNILIAQKDFVDCREGNGKDSGKPLGGRKRMVSERQTGERNLPYALQNAHDRTILFLA
jgi:hypothetical protein